MIKTLLKFAFGIILRIWAPWINLFHRLFRKLTSPCLFLISRIFSKCTSAVYTTIISTCTIIVLLWTSILLYGSFYNSYVPTVSHQRNVNLLFSADCEISGGGVCTFPSSNFTLGTSRNAEILRKGQAYNIILELDLPETPVNQQLGMFMVELTFYSYNGEIIKKSSRAVSSMLRYKSYLLQVIETVFYLPLYLFGSREQKQTLDVELFKSYVEDSYMPTIGVVVEVQTRKIHIYNSVLHLHAVFSGLRYFMYEWPLFSSLLGISTIFFFLSIVALLSLYNYGTFRSNSEENLSSEYASHQPLDLDYDQVEREKLAAKEERLKVVEIVGGVDASATRGTPDGDGNSKESLSSGISDKILKSKVEDILGSSFSNLRHRKPSDSTGS